MYIKIYQTYIEYNVFCLKILVLRVVLFKMCLLPVNVEFSLKKMKLGVDKT